MYPAPNVISRWRLWFSLLTVFSRGVMVHGFAPTFVNEHSRLRAAVWDSPWAIAQEGCQQVGRSRLALPLLMGKGFNNAKNKQAELAKKMEAAKKKQNGEEGEPEVVAAIETEDEKLQRDREEFAQLLLKSSALPKPEKRLSMSRSSDQATSASVPTNRGPKVKAKTLKKRKMKQGGKNDNNQDGEEEDAPLQQGDIARRRDFEPLLSTETSIPLGPITAAQLVPWVPPFLSNYLVVVADPRAQSGDLHQTIQYLSSNLEPKVLHQVMVVTADSPAETVSWKRRAGLVDESDSNIQIYSDNTKLDWMRQYSAVVDDERWSMSIIVFCTRGIIQTLVRQVDPSKASALVLEAIQTIEA